MTRPYTDFSHVLGNLWIGAAPEQGRALTDLGFKVLVLCAHNYQPPADRFEDVEVFHAPFRDREDVTSDELRTAIQAAHWTADRIREGKKTLVTCMAGWNRSGLVSAMALALLSNRDPAWCGEIVRRKRYPGIDPGGALSNPVFVNFLNRLRNDDCELCAAKHETQRFYEDHVCWIALCKTCQVPMAVLRRHSTSPTPEERQHMIQLLWQIAGQLAPERPWYPTFTRRSIPDHWHAHMRLAPG